MIGVTLLELMITLAVIVGLGAMAWPAYQNYERRTYFADVITAIAPFKAGVMACYQDTHTLADCNGGAHHVPMNILKVKGALNSLSVQAGVIVAKPVPQQGVLESDTYVLTPTVKDKALNWVVSGGAVDNGYAE
jgi:type IV pilus assembly protein PilA